MPVTEPEIAFAMQIVQWVKELGLVNAAVIVAGIYLFKIKDWKKAANLVDGSQFEGLVKQVESLAGQVSTLIGALERTIRYSEERFAKVDQHLENGLQRFQNIEGQVKELRAQLEKSPNDTAFILKDAVREIIQELKKGE